MQSLDDQANEEEEQEKLEQDFDKPFSEPADIKGQNRLSREDIRLDGDEDEDQWYQEGRNAAAGVPDNPRDDIEGGHQVG